MKKRKDSYLVYVEKYYPEKTVPEIARLFDKNENHAVSLSTIERDLYRIVNSDDFEGESTKSASSEENSRSEESEDPDWTWGEDSDQGFPFEENEPAQEAVGLTEIERHYFYNKEDDVYIVWLSNRNKNVQVDGDTVREMKRAYSNQIGDGDTINEICHRFGWRRQDFHDFKVALGWTHGEDPYTDEEHVLKSTPDLVSDMAMLQRGEFERQWNRKKWKNTIDDAHKWRNFKRGHIEPFMKHVSSNPPRRDVIELSGEEQDFMAIFAPQDLHVGKLTVDGEGIKETREHLLETTERLITQIKSRGIPERLVVILGSDWWHVDSESATTTSGTPQDVDGLPATGLVAGYELQVELIDMLRSLGKVQVRMVPGNHDWRTCQLAWCGLRHGYRDIEEVEIASTFNIFQYEKYGDVAIGFHHGHGVKGGRSKKPLQYGMIMAKHHPDLWGETKFRYWIVGHLHGLDETDDGITILQTPSLSGDDRWHYLNGYTTRDRGQAAYIFDRQYGLVSRELALMR